MDRGKVMYVRKRKNISGSYSVMLCIGERSPGKKHPTSRMIKSFGVARDEKHLGELLAEAERYKKYMEYNAPKAKTLRINTERDILFCRSCNVGFYDVYGHFFQMIFNSLPLKDNVARKLKDITVMRIAYPCSKRRTAIIAEEYGIDFNVDHIYKMMDQLDDPIVLHIKQVIYKHTHKILAEQKQSVDILFYDLTTIYFETNTQDELRDFGFSKDGKHQHVQIMLAVIVSKEGLPIDYEEFPGNSYEGHTLLPVIHKIRARYAIDKTIIVADAALMNKINLQELDAYGIQYIIAARLKNSKKEIKASILDLSNYNVISITPTNQQDTYDQILSKMIVSETGDYIFAYHSTKRARKDAYDREKDLEKIKKYLNRTGKNKLTSRLNKPYVKISKDCKITIDPKKLNLEAQYDGFFGLRTNIKNADATEILQHYRGLWQVEQTFRITKSNLEIRPVFHYTPSRIRAHFLICYMALSLIRYVEFTLKTKGLNIPPEQLFQLLNNTRKIKLIDSKNQTFQIFEDPPAEVPLIYQALKIKLPKKFEYLSNL